jgi:hypothetical protein
MIVVLAVVIAVVYWLQYTSADVNESRAIDAMDLMIRRLFIRITTSVSTGIVRTYSTVSDPYVGCDLRSEIQVEKDVSVSFHLSSQFVRTNRRGSSVVSRQSSVVRKVSSVKCRHSSVQYSLRERNKVGTSGGQADSGKQNCNPEISEKYLEYRTIL